MSKRTADSEQGETPLKGGDRPEKMEVDDRDMGEFEDEFEDEFESEDEIIEAGVDGRPDAEREAEAKGGKYLRQRPLVCSRWHLKG
jgi:ribosome assembly protein RRB1